MDHPTTPPPDSARVERVLTERLMSGHTTLRLISLLLWLVFALAYGEHAPWWMIGLPAAVHFVAMAGFVWLSHAYARKPDAYSVEGWRRLYILCAGLTGLAYGGGGALLFNLPYDQPRLLVAAILCVSAALAPGRVYEPRSYLAFAGLDLSLLSIAALLSNDPLWLAIGVGALIYLVALLMQNAVQARNQRTQVTLALANENLARLNAEAEAKVRAARDALHDALESL